MVGYGPDPNDRQMTTYFRKRFIIGNPSDYDDLILRLLRDDGAVVYINNQEVVRSNMPAGTINYSSIGQNSITGDDESVFHEYPIPSSMLVSGENLIAVQVHQHSPQSSDLSFDLELSGITQAMQPPVVFMTAPTDGANLDRNTTTTLRAVATDPDGKVRNVGFRANGGAITGCETVTSVPYECRWTPGVDGVFQLTAVATDTDGLSTVSSPVEVIVGATYASTPVVSGLNAWKYLDDGSDPGTRWTDADFDDGQWGKWMRSFRYWSGSDTACVRLCYLLFQNDGRSWRSRIDRIAGISARIQ